MNYFEIIDDDKPRVVADEVLHHIDIMYPGMWKGVPKSARKSLRNTIEKEVKLALEDTAKNVEWLQECNAFLQLAGGK